MEKVLVDTNIVLDLLLKRENFFNEAQDLFTLADQNRAKLFISALTIANTHYVLFKNNKSDDVRKILNRFKVLVEVLPLNDKILELALSSDFNDFEDAIQYHTALEHGVHIVVTRNKKDFKNSALPVLTAKEYMSK